MALNIPSYIYDAYNELVDLVQRDIVLYYPPKRTECPNCYFVNTVGRGRSVTVYKDGGPAPFPNGSPCPYCNGKGNIESEVTETIQSRVYLEPQQWARKYNIKIPEGGIMTIFDLVNSSKVQQSNYMIPKINGLETHFTDKYYRIGDIFSNSFGLNPTKYSTCFWGKNTGQT